MRGIKELRVKKIYGVILLFLLVGCAAHHEQKSDDIALSNDRELELIKASKTQKHQEQVKNARKRKYKLTQEIDKLTSVTPKQKLIAWDRFLRFLSKESMPSNKYETDMRYYAGMRMRYWENFEHENEPGQHIGHKHVKYPDAKEVGRDGRFTAYSNGVVYDEESGLEWFIGPDKNITWGEARAWVNELSAVGGGWDMPSRKELKTLFKKDVERGITPLIKTTGWWVWASEHDSSSSAWYFNFSRGYASWSSQLYSDGERVFAVRLRKEFFFSSN